MPASGLTRRREPRRSRAEAVARLLLLAVDENARRAPARPDVYAWLNDAANATRRRRVDWSTGAATWFARWSLPLSELSRDRCDQFDSKLATKDDGGVPAASTTGRYRKVIRQCLDVAVEVGVADANNWPQPRTTGRRKAKTVRPVNASLLPEVPVAWAAIQTMRSHQPASVMYRDMSGLIPLTGSRPSEVLDLWDTDLELPKAPGRWGAMQVCHADQRAGVAYADLDDDTSGDTKTGIDREMPVPPLAVFDAPRGAEAPG